MEGAILDKHLLYLFKTCLKKYRQLITFSKNQAPTIDMIDENKKSETDILAGLRSNNSREQSATIRRLCTPEWTGMARKAVQSVGGREADVEDVFQESLAALVKNVMYGKFREESKLSTYFYEICRRKCMKMFQKNKFIAIDNITIEDTNPSLENLLMDKEEREEKRALVNQLLEELGEPCTSILKYRKLDFSYEEIAGELDYDNPDTVKNQASRCRRRMRKLILADPGIYKKLKVTR